MNLIYYRNFIQIVECGTISAASRKLLIAQPALSSQLKAMERELGADLLERSARRVTLTNAGKILYEKAKLILSLQDAAEKEIQACVCGSRETVMLGATPAMPDALFSSILTSFRRENMDALLDLYEMSSAAIIEMLKEGGIYDLLAPFYPAVGRSSVDPVSMFKMLLMGYLYGIKSERRPVQEIQLNIAYRWFCGFEPADKIPDHSTFSRTRIRKWNDSQLFSKVFIEIVRQCIEAGLRTNSLS